MARDPRAAALALHRFGLGPRNGTIAAIAFDPQGALLAELDHPEAGLIADLAAGLPSSSAAARAVFEYRTAPAALLEHFPNLVRIESVSKSSGTWSELYG